MRDLCGKGHFQHVGNLFPPESGSLRPFHFDKRFNGTTVWQPDDFSLAVAQRTIDVLVMGFQTMEDFRVSLKYRRDNVPNATLPLVSIRRRNDVLPPTLYPLESVRFGCYHVRIVASSCAVSVLIRLALPQRVQRVTRASPSPQIAHQNSEFEQSCDIACRGIV